MHNQFIVRKTLKDLTFSETLREMMDFFEVTGDQREAPGQELGSKAMQSRRALSHLSIHQADAQWEKPIKRLYDGQRHDGAWTISAKLFVPRTD